MVLHGTVRDLGIADVFQLLAQQQKTGVLRIKYGDEEVQVFFKEGVIARAQTNSRKKHELIGAMLVRSEQLTELQLEDGLKEQRRTLEKLGEILVRSGAVSAAIFRQALVLQTTEMIFRLFSWKRGKYQFTEGGQVELDPEFGPSLRTELVLMEGLQQLQEWPRIRRRVPRFGMTFERVASLPPEETEGEAIGPAERMIHSLVEPGRDVRRLVELSRLGEFETCKAIANLLNGKYLRAARSSGAAGWVGRDGRHGEEVGTVLGRWLLWVAALLGLAFGVSRLDLGALAGAGTAPSSYSDPAIQRLLSRPQLQRLSAALELYRAEQGELPRTLESLVDQALLEPEDLRYPWQDPYYYRRLNARQFILLPPLR